MSQRRLTVAVHVDGLVNIAAGTGLIAAGAWLAPHVGLDDGWVLRLAGAFLVVYGVENHLVARRPAQRG